MIFWHGCRVLDFDLRYLDTRDIAMQSALGIDPKALFDSIRAEVPQLQGDKRTKIEIMIIKQKIDEIGSKLRWISSETQLADGVTKMAARQLLADRIRTHLLSLQSDKPFKQPSARLKLNNRHQLHAMPLDAWSTKAVWATSSGPTSLCQREARIQPTTISLTSPPHLPSSSSASLFCSAFKE